MHIIHKAINVRYPLFYYNHVFKNTLVQIREYCTFRGKKAVEQAFHQGHWSQLDMWSCFPICEPALYPVVSK